MGLSESRDRGKPLTPSPSCLTKLDDLPTELLAFIISFLSVRDKVRLRCVSRKLRSASETPSLWREFVWPYYYTGDEGCVNNVLKVCGQHVKRLSFPHHVTPSKLLKVFEYCSNVVELSLPTTKLDPDQLAEVSLHMKHLQKLDIQWDNDVENLLGMNLKELTIRVENLPVKYYTEPWKLMEDWMMKKFVPQKINIITSDYDSYSVAIGDFQVTSKSTAPVGHIGHVKIFSRWKAPLNLYPVLPEFQLDFGQGVNSPFVIGTSVGIDQKGLLVITDCGEAACRAKIREVTDPIGIELNHNITSLQCVTEFVMEFDGLSCKHLEQLAISCPRLQRLDLHNNKSCLNDLQGLCAIADSCHNLQGLNLLGIPVTEVEDQTRLWEILNDMKLTHLAVEMCVLLPSVDSIRMPSVEEQEKLISLFQKCISIQALESCCNNDCIICTSMADKDTSLFSHFPSLVHCTIRFGPFPNTFALQNIVTTCEKIKCLNYSDASWGLTNASLLKQCSSLEQFYFNSFSTDLSNKFMTALSAHGRLVHVVLYVKAVASEGITTLVSNSPDLLTFCALVTYAIFDDTQEIFKAKLKQQFSDRQLFRVGTYIMKVMVEDNTLPVEVQDTDLFSLWD